jgi:hypothetical protein
MEAEINALGQDPNTPSDVLVAEILELATVAREHMGDRDRAAELLHQALGVDPMHEEALARYVDHFRERRDWRGLIDLYEFALDTDVELVIGSTVDTTYVKWRYKTVSPTIVHACGGSFRAGIDDCQVTSKILLGARDRRDDVGFRLFSSAPPK